jgi:hypothetical protein
MDNEDATVPFTLCRNTSISISSALAITSSFQNVTQLLSPSMFVISTCRHTWSQAQNSTQWERRYGMILSQISSGGRKDAEGGDNEKKTRKLQMLHKSKADTRLVCRECSEGAVHLDGSYLLVRERRRDGEKAVRFDLFSC